MRPMLSACLDEVMRYGSGWRCVMLRLRLYLVIVASGRRKEEAIA